MTRRVVPEGNIAAFAIGLSHPSSTLRNQISSVPSRSFVNRNCRCTGDQDTQCSFRDVASSVLVLEPSSGSSMMSSSRWREPKAMRVPSGDTAGAASMPVPAVRGRTWPFAVSDHEQVVA